MSGWVMWTAISIFDGVGQVQEGMRTFSQPRAVDDAPNAPTLAAPRGEIRFDDVTFHYGKGAGVIERFSLRIAPGEKVGLVGRSGAGKSTLVNLLLRFYDVEGGEILIDGENIASTSQESVRRKIGMVTQDTSLLHRSIADNILYGRPEASREEMIMAARAAHADAFVSGLTDPEGRVGYDTMVGERGVKLSGGQRQRIAIARVMLKDAPILVLDEATSALDSEIEQAIQENLQTLMAGKTVIAIAHRLSTIAAMDRLVVLDEGRIVETGTHRELLAGDGLYAVAVAAPVRRLPQSGGVRSAKDRGAPSEAIRRPELLGVVVSFEGGDARGQRDPRDFGAGVDVHVGRQGVRRIEGADAHEAQLLDAAVFAGDRRLARLAAEDSMPLPAVGRDGDRRRRVGEHVQAIAFDQRIEYERAAGLALAAQAMAAMHEQRRARHPVAHPSARTAALKRRHRRLRQNERGKAISPKNTSWLIASVQTWFMRRFGWSIRRLITVHH